MLAADIKTEAARLGFELAGIAPAVTPGSLTYFQDWLQRGFAGEMKYLERREAAYQHPGSVLADVKSVIVLGTNYRSADRSSSGPLQGLVSRYAWGAADYHDVLRERLRLLADYVESREPNCRTRGVVDTAPLLERDFARLAGLGWFGKNTMLINKRQGSWFFLSALLVDIEPDYDAAHTAQHCGTCTRCIEACPTDAFVEPYVLDAARCISYLTIELRGDIPRELRTGVGSWMFGCDICQDVCPWNSKAPRSPDPLFAPAADLAPADAAELLGMDEAEFRARFRGTALARPKRAGLLRNAAIVLGNGGDRCAVPALARSLHDGEPVIRSACAWSLGQLGGEHAEAALQERLAVEEIPEIRAEIEAALAVGKARVG